ncbi:DUF6221 family protein [Streptomyces sp. NPDC059568]|uniref:DUF6221 family protein n=1 Tax=Streptomyces sp. NPDC059568 TaxID=3346868 RepID=UPI0036A81C32
MTTTEIAAEHGVSRQTIHSYRRTGAFPKPAEGDGSTRPRFREDEVAAFFAANPKQPGKRTDLDSRDEGASVETTEIAMPPGATLEAAAQFVNWLRARFDEDEQAARAAMWDDASATWTARPPQADYERYTVVDYCDDGVVAVTPENADADGVGRHVARHDPARVLAEVEGKRRIVDIYANALEERVALRARMREVIRSDSDEFGRLHRQESELIETAERMAPVVRLLALPYADRPGYREEWRP